MHRWLFIFILLFSANASIAAVFVVTNNADAGPGTLREALTLAAANGVTGTDYINFNLPGTSEAARTIVISTSLPDVSSNVIIDGTTQTGVVFGQSSAKVKVATIKQPVDIADITIFNAQNATGIEIYGLYIYDYTDIVISRPDAKMRTGIRLTDCTNITIGAANKGNLISGFHNNSLDLEGIDNIKIQANTIGLNKLNTIGNEGEDGGANYGCSGFINLDRCDHLLLGGNLNEGNTIFTGIQMKYFQQTASTVSIRGNNFMTYQDGLSTIYSIPDFYFPMIQLSTVFADDITTVEEERAVEAAINMDISNNLSGGGFSLFHFRLLTGVVNFTNNYFNVARDGVTDIKTSLGSPVNQQPIFVEDSKAQFNIGTNDKTKRNLFYNIQTGVIASAAPHVYLRYNDFKCVLEVAYKNDNPQNDYTIPAVNIDGVQPIGASTRVTGTATPNSTIDLYSSESCQSQCSIRSYLQTTTADAAGKWQADITDLNGVFYAAATVNNQTSEYETFKVNVDNVHVQALRCQDFGTITGIKIPSGLSYYWIDETGAIVSHDLDLKVTESGKYRLVLGSGCITSDEFVVDDNRVEIDASGIQRQDISCGSANGSIKGIVVFDPLDKIKTTVWTNEHGTDVGHTVDIDQLPPGIYLLTVTTLDGCTNTYGVVTLKNTSGPAIDESAVIKQSTNCGQSTGSITNLTVTGTGTLHYSWKNEAGTEVLKTKDLSGQPAGTYTLQVTDDSQCPPVYSSKLVIAETNGITLTEPPNPAANASCGKSNGSIIGITATGATTFSWRDVNNNTVGSQPDLKEVPAGTYQLTVSNGFCEKQSMVYQILETPPIAFPSTYTVNHIDACYGVANGALQVNADVLIKSVRWINDAGVPLPVGAHNDVTGIPAGSYKLYLTDQNGCESYYNTYQVAELPEFKIADQGQKTDDQCGSKTGSVTGVTVTGGLPPYTYQWSNAVGTPVGTNSNINGLAAGAYRLHVADSRCGALDLDFNIALITAVIDAPSASDIQLCTPGNAILMVNNPAAGSTYRLYDQSDSAIPLDEQASGHFTISVTANRSFFVTRVTGACESTPRTEVKVGVGVSPVNIANTFTPNADGYNDYWKIAGIENYPQALVQVFNRNGQKLFESKGYAQPFNGTYNGKPLPVGVYYYIISLNKSCSLLSGSLTIIR